MTRLNVGNIRHPDGSSDNISLDSSGRVLVGTTSGTNNIRIDQKLAVATAGDGLFGGLALTSYVGTTANRSSILDLNRSRGTTDGSLTAVAAQDRLGAIYFRGADGTNFVDCAAIEAVVDGTPGSNDMPGRLVFSTTADGASSPTEAMRIDSSQNLRFNSGYGSVATAYGVRAWVNFNGSGTVSIRGSGNVSSISDNGTGQFYTNFANGMPDTNYAGVCSHNAISGGNDGAQASPDQTYRAFVQTGSAGAWRDPSVVCVAIFR